MAPHILQLRGKSCLCMKGAVKERFNLFVCSSLFPCILQSLLVIFSVMSHSVCVIMRRGTHSQLQLLSVLPCLTHFESSGMWVKGFSKLKKKRGFSCLRNNDDIIPTTANQRRQAALPADWWHSVHSCQQGNVRPKCPSGSQGLISRRDLHNVIWWSIDQIWSDDQSQTNAITDRSCLDAARADLSGFESNRISSLIPLEIMSSTSDKLMCSGRFVAFGGWALARGLDPKQAHGNVLQWDHCRLYTSVCVGIARNF